MRYTQYLTSLEKFGINLGLERISYLLEKLGNPHLKFKSIHIAGTNGKGSTAAMAASILKEAGYKVGLYTSPHLFDYTERIKINGKDISKHDFMEGLRRVKKAAEEMRRQKRARKENPTVFEALTAVAFWYFAKKKIDYAVVEVGLGGRLDATNVISPLVSIITNIDYEHTEVLGKNLSKIAREKAGIIKPGVPVVTAEDKRKPLKVIRDRCEKRNCFLIGVGPGPTSPATILVGKHQKINAACAISAIRLAGIWISKAAIRRGLQKVNWPGRIQVISKDPRLIVDGAHNPAGAKALRVTIQEIFPGKYTLLFGCQKTKEFKKIWHELKPIASKIIITKSSHKLAAEPRKISKYLKKEKIGNCLTGSVKEGFSLWDKKKPLLVTGSLFAVADVLNYLDA
ncbi:hypothetical protein AMJ44_07340 [candidate division WOR-1 bacterium DG_54_3]|uniref:tetrahydrofolate synthase n=1 Tax=candidate division WOR-1 bacterium DG_54_3 TaxID=1703775 RepID=A0A0S7XYW5_UNCSA|nr:MAG: hypothetical protein AMJ44_07340 [candidate division WOR-1 bacterium DG_54_3]